MVERASLTRLDTLLVDRPRPNTPELSELAVFLGNSDIQLEVGEKN